MLEFDFQVYPRKLWIGSKEECLDNFLDRDQEKLDLGPDTYDALTVDVTHKDTLDYGYFVILTERAKASVMGHEATHVALDLCSDVDMKPDTDNQEPLAYLIGFICKCIANYKNNETD